MQKYFYMIKMIQLAFEIKNSLQGSQNYFENTHKTEFNSNHRVMSVKRKKNNKIK